MKKNVYALAFFYFVTLWTSSVYSKPILEPDSLSVVNEKIIQPEFTTIESDAKSLKKKLPDSAQIYQNLIKKYRSKGTEFNSIGNILLPTGIGITLLGLFTMTGAGSSTSDAESFLKGYLFLHLGIAATSIGLPIKLVGMSKLKRAIRYERALESYDPSRESRLLPREMKLIPFHDFENKRDGINLVCTF